MIDAIRKFFERCPVLSDGKINVDYLPPGADNEYTIDSVPCEPVVKRYVDGGGIYQYLFVFAGRKWYSYDQVQNIDNSKLFDAVSRWIEECDRKEIYPDLDGATATGISVLSTGYLIEYDAAANTARYQLQARLTYYKD